MILLEKGSDAFPEIMGLFCCPACGQSHHMTECFHVAFLDFTQRNEEGDFFEHNFVVCMECLMQRVEPQGRG